MGAAVLVASSVATPVMAESMEDWLTGDYATGDWGGLRTSLEDAGVTFEGAYTTDIMAVRNGNAGSGDGWAYAGRVDASVEFDMEKLAGASGLTFFVSGAWSSGDDLSDNQVGNLFAVQQIYTGEAVRLSQLYVKQELPYGGLAVKLGRLTTEEDFLASDIYTNYVSGGINGTPANIPGSNAGFTTAPYAQWGAVISAEPADGLRLAAGVYNADDKANQDKRNGVDFALDGDAVLGIGEISYSWNQPAGESEAGAVEEAHQSGGEAAPAAADGLPGTVKFGALYESGNREDLRTGRKKDGSPGFYMSLEQMVWSEPGSSEQGLTPWAVVAWLPRHTINEMPVFFAGGLVYRGLIPGRDEDSTALGFLYGDLSEDIEPGGSEKVLEVAYTAQLTPWFYVRPDLQLVFDPAGVNSADTAVVFGGEIGIVF